MDRVVLVEGMGGVLDVIVRERRDKEGVGLEPVEV